MSFFRSLLRTSFKAPTPTSFSRLSRYSFHGSSALRLRIGDTAPDFSAETTEGKVDFHSWMGDSWAILFSHPADYTPVCTTELGLVEKLKSEFDKRKVKVIGLSCDDLNDHKGWIKDIVETQNLKSISYPLIADKDRKIAQLYDMLDQTNINKEGLPMTVRSVYIIGPDKQVKLMLTYPASTGRNFDEILRVIDSLQLTAYHKVATPGNWKDGEKCVILPSVSNDEADKLFPKGYQVVKPYLRMTQQPNK